MAHGFQLSNAFSRVQVDQSSSAPRLIASGVSVSLGNNAHMVAYDTGYPLTQEPPIVMLRPHVAGKHVGGGAITLTGFLYYGQCSFDYAVFSTLGTPVSDGSQYGMEVYRSDGSVAYSSRHTHPRIRTLVSMPPTTALGGGYPKTAPLSGYTAMPWVQATSLIQTGLGQSETSEGTGGVTAAIDATFTTLTIELTNMNPAFPGGAFPTLRSFIGAALAGDYDPYFGQPSFFSVGVAF